MEARLMNKLYKFRGRITSMDGHAAMEAMLSAERECRTGEFKYPPDLVYQSQINDIKSIWPPSLKQLVKDRATELAAGRPVTATEARRAMEDIVFGALVQSRVSAKSQPTSSVEEKAKIAETESKIASADLALSTLMGIAPYDGTVIGPRKTRIGIAATRTSWARTPGMLSVKVSDIGMADAYFLCHYVQSLRRSWLIGWATREEMALSERGNKSIDPEKYPWSPMSYCRDASKLRPMSSAIKALGLTDVPEGLLFEAPPRNDDVLWQSGDIESFMTTNEQSGKDFYAILGLDGPTQPEAAREAPSSTQSKDNEF
jgi:hypothetical protein